MDNTLAAEYLQDTLQKARAFEKKNAYRDGKPVPFEELDDATAWGIIKMTTEEKMEYDPESKMRVLKTTVRSYIFKDPSEVIRDIARILPKLGAAGAARVGPRAPIRDRREIAERMADNIIKGGGMEALSAR